MSKCASVLMPDAQSLPAMVSEHEYLFGEKALTPIATDKGYYALDNIKFLENKKVEEIGIPRPSRVLNAPRNKMNSAVMEKLHNRRADIEGLIGHLKQGWQMGRSRMKSDTTTLAAGYAAVLGFNLRQLKRYAIGKIHLKTENGLQNAILNHQHDENALHFFDTK